MWSTPFIAQLLQKCITSFSAGPKNSSSALLHAFIIQSLGIIARRKDNCYKKGHREERALPNTQCQSCEVAEQVEGRCSVTIYSTTPPLPPVVSLPAVYKTFTCITISVRHKQLLSVVTTLHCINLLLDQQLGLTLLSGFRVFTEDLFGA